MIALLVAAAGAIAFLAAIRALHRIRLADQARFAAWDRQRQASQATCNAIWNATPHSIPQQRKETGQ